MKWEYKYEKLKKGKSAIFAVNSGIQEEMVKLNRLCSHYRDFKQPISAYEKSLRLRSAL
uniref:Uncharacterized protein n=1 Tax=viral metagenome TaxID=1070528 RepID=A0A6M3L280_9ZZZZ